MCDFAPPSRQHLASFRSVNMFRASPWISYDPSHHHLDLSLTEQPDDDDVPPEYNSPQSDMEAPEISTLREEEEETPPPDAGGLSFSKFRVNLWGQGAGASGSSTGPPLGPPASNRRGPTPPESDDDDEEDQLIDDDELAIVTETGRKHATSSPGSLVTGGSPNSTPSPRKRGGVTRPRQRRSMTGRRGRPGREPPDAAAMMSTFEVTKAEQGGSSSAQIVPPVAAMVAPPLPLPPPQTAPSSSGDWMAASSSKPPRKKPGPKKGSTLGPRGPRKNASKTAHNTPGSSTPLLDDSVLNPDPSTFLVPAPPSIPPTPGPDQPSLPPSHLPPILPPDLALDPSIPIPVYPLPTRAFPVQPPPKVPTGYAPSQPIDTKRGPVRKWTIMQREIKGIAGGRWFARTWVAPQTLPQTATAIRPISPPVYTAASPPLTLPDAGPSRISGSAAGSRASSVKIETGPLHALSELEIIESARWARAGPDVGSGILSRGPASVRTSITPSPPPGEQPSLSV
ncbi:hypothetical protein K439DRAFT_1660116 [Ramaria rubella]|nr:hypothetical protein K439DRAFT_1660116 [Ramaria rubella]